MAESTEPLKLFYCYAREDRGLRDELDKHLMVLRRMGMISSWYDGEIVPGGEWKREIHEHLQSAQVILLLISAHFMASDYCYTQEMEQALQRHKKGEARVIPIILRPVFWQILPLANLQALPEDGRPVTSWRNRDQAFQSIVEGIHHVVEHFGEMRRQERQRLEQTTRRRFLFGGLITLVLLGGGTVGTLYAAAHIGSASSSVSYTDLLTLKGSKNQQVWHLAWSPDTRRLVSAGSQNVVTVWDTNVGKTAYLFAGHMDAVTSVTWSPDGYRIASGSYDKTVQVWSSDGAVLPPNTAPPYTYKGHTDKVLCVAWSPDGHLLASGAAAGDRTVQIWSADSATLGKKVTTYSRHGNSINALAWYPQPTAANRYLIASGSGDATVQIWDTLTGVNALTYTGHLEAAGVTNHVLAVAWSPDGSLLASSGLADQVVRVWSPTTQQTMRVYAGHSQRVEAIAWSPDGRYLASASADKTVQIWEAASGRTLCVYTNHHRPVHTVSWLANNANKILASGGEDSNVHLWKISVETTRS